MLSRLARAANSVNPMQGGIDEGLLTLRAFRLTGVLAAGLLPVYGWAYHASGLPIVDPWAFRIGFVALIAGVFALTYVSDSARRHARLLHEAMIYSLTGYFGWLVVANGLAADYALGYLFVFAGLALSHSIAYTHFTPFARYLAFSVAVSGVAVALSPEADVSRTLFLLSVAGLALLLYITVVARMATYGALAASRSRLAAAEALARTGSWDHDLRNDRRVWSDGLYALLGVAPADSPEASAPPLSQVVHPDDRAAIEALREALLASGTGQDFRFRTLAPDGSVRSFRAVVVLERDRGGRPVRFTGAVVDVTEHDRREADLREARDRAEAGGRAKSAFLANMSHEIRTPLTAIIGYAQILGEEVGEAHRDLVAPIATGGERLLDTLNSVLDLARMEDGHADLTLEPVDIGAEAWAAAEMLGGRASARGLAVTVDAASDATRALADRAALGRVLANLVSNAVKFTDAGGVAICVRPAADARVEVAVSDTGCGMNEAFLETLYEPFQQASTGWARSHEGTGLGLTITRRLVEDMGGTIRVESAPGEGTTFTVSLAAALPQAAVQTPVSARARSAA